MSDGAGDHGHDANTQQPHRSQQDQGEKEQERENKETGKETKNEKGTRRSIRTRWIGHW